MSRALFPPSVLFGLLVLEAIHPSWVTLGMKDDKGHFPYARLEQNVPPVFLALVSVTFWISVKGLRLHPIVLVELLAPYTSMVVTLLCLIADDRFRYGRRAQRKR